MANGFYRAQVIIPMDSGLPQDAAVNVWAFADRTGSADHSANATQIINSLDAFYTAIAGLYSSQCVLSAVQFKVFNMEDDQPRVPIFDGTTGFGTEVSANMDFPAEVACCLSFRGQQLSGANARRRRGRIYIGPLQSSTTTDYHMVLAGMITTIMGAADTALAPASGNVRWHVYSPYTHHGVPVGANINDKVPGTDTPLYPENPALVDQAFVPVTHYWMDNAWDTQRRRGPKATSRTTASV